MAHFVFSETSVSSLVKNETDTAMIDERSIKKSHVVPSLLSQNPTLNTFSPTAVLAAARAGQHDRLLSLLLQNDMNERIQVVDWMGRTPLHRAARYNHVEILQLLLQYGARIDVVDVHGQSPLHSAAAHGHAEALNVLICHFQNKDPSSLALACFKDERRGFTPDDYWRARRDGDESGGESDGKQSGASGERKLNLRPRLSPKMMASLKNSLKKPTELFVRRPFCPLLLWRRRRGRRRRRRSGDDDDGGGGEGREDEDTGKGATSSTNEKRKENRESDEMEEDRTGLNVLVAPLLSTSFLQPILTYTKKDYMNFNMNGYHIFSKFLSQQHLEYARARVNVLYESLHPDVDPLRMYNLHQCDEIWILHLARNPSIAKVVEQHCGSNYYFYLSHIISKSPGSNYQVRDVLNLFFLYSH